jgi:hypothetical protein
MLMQREFNKMEGAIDGTFYKRFLTWLMGKGQEEDHIRTPWYRQAQALELEEVRELLEAFLWEIHIVENQLLKLVWKGPQTLNEYYLYFKYVLQHQEFVLETDPWFFLEWRQYSKDNVVMDEHGKPEARAGLDQANLGHEARPAETGVVIESMLNFFAELQSVTKSEVEAIRKDAEARRQQRLRDQQAAAIMDPFSEDDEAEDVAKAEDPALNELREEFQKLNSNILILSQNIAKTIKPDVPEPEEEMVTAPSTPERVPSPSGRKTPPPPPTTNEPSAPTPSEYLDKRGLVNDVGGTGKFVKKEEITGTDPEDLPYKDHPSIRMENLYSEHMDRVMTHIGDEMTDAARKWLKAEGKTYSLKQIQRLQWVPRKPYGLVELTKLLGPPPPAN